jgi:snoRNA binding domain-containing protein (fibrillarin)
VRPTLVVGSGPALFVLGSEGVRVSGPFPFDADSRTAAVRYEAMGRSDVPTRLLAALESVPAEARILASPAPLARAIAESLGRTVESPTLEELRRVRSLIPLPDPGPERRFFLALGHLRLEAALRAPEEVLVTLAREEERVERSVGREARAHDSFVSVPDSPLDRHLVAWGRARGALGDLEEALRRTLESEARLLVPNLSAVVGPRIAARLVAAAGGVNALARMPAPRIQLLGSRRRPSPDRGPRFGIIYRADRLADVPIGRRGAYARSLAALAAIAVRADAHTRRDISAELVARRDRRIEALKRRRR